MQRYQNSLHSKFFPISVKGGGGHGKSIFSQIQKSPNYPRGGGGQEHYGLFPQIMVFFILNRPLREPLFLQIEFKLLFYLHK